MKQNLANLSNETKNLGKSQLRCGYNLPLLLRLLVIKELLPQRPQWRRQSPSQGIVAQPQPHDMPGVPIVVSKAFSRVEDGEVVDEEHVTLFWCQDRKSTR